jgi:hypothetical protein
MLSNTMRAILKGPGRAIQFSLIAALNRIMEDDISKQGAII